MPFARFPVELRLDERWDAVPERYRADALALYFDAVLYSAEMLKDGVVTKPVILSFAESRGVKKGSFVFSRLVDSGLVRELRPGVFEIVDWAEYHSSRRDVEEQRKRATERKRKSRGQLTFDDVTPGVTAGQAQDVTGGQGRPSRAHARAETATDTSTPQPPSPGGRIAKKQLRRYTGCRAVRGSHGASYVRDPLGVDKPPPDWPHERPLVEEVMAALNGTGEPEVIVRELVADGRTLEETEQEIDRLELNEDERIRLVDLAADLRSEQASSAGAV